jgi:amino-acid N-acetyltransferase
MLCAMPLRCEPAQPHDLAGALELLQRSSLPREGVVEHFGNYKVVRDDTRVVGVCGLEVHGDDGLLRSVAVAPEYRGGGVGRMLVDAMLALAGKMELRGVYLLTTTARTYFAGLGFADCPREQAPAEIRASWEFRSGCPSSSAFMRRDPA